MTDHTVAHATFTLERTYPVPPARVFAAWADSATKRRWFAGGDPGHELDFRVGGREVNHAHHGGAVIVFDSLYRDIVADERIVYSSVLSQDGRPATVSTTTVELETCDEGTRLVLTEQGAYLDGLEQPDWREQGTGEWLGRLGAELRNAIEGGH
jgi:uncharacterized protein YndB with AHSA1/START domain